MKKNIIFLNENGFQKKFLLRKDIFLNIACLCRNKKTNEKMKNFMKYVTKKLSKVWGKISKTNYFIIFYVSHTMTAKQEFSWRQIKMT